MASFRKPGVYIQDPDESHEKFLRSLIINGKQTYIIVNYNFWVEHQDELEAWLETNTEAGTDTQEGMTLNFVSEQEELMFMLRWR